MKAHPQKTSLNVAITLTGTEKSAAIGCKEKAGTERGGQSSRTDKKLRHEQAILKVLV
jgi:hypothetical protein